MSDEEEQYSEEEVEEEEVEEAEAAEEAKPARTKQPSIDDENLTEAEKAMLAAKKRHEEEEQAKLQAYEEGRRLEREKEEEELRLLKEKQEQRKLQREEEEREQAERRRQDEERHRLEEEERKARMEAERNKKEEEKKKRLAMMSGPMGAVTAGGGRNFTVPEKKDKNDKFGNIVQAKQEMGMTKEQIEDAKNNFLAQIMKQLDLSSFSGAELKAKVKELHHRICKLETEKYDLEKRDERQAYDLRELNERQRQVTRQKVGASGGGGDDTGGRHPPKITLVSKYDRQIDRRNFKERRSMFDKKNAFPCFPNVAPPPVILEFKLQEDGQGQEGRENGEEEYEEEYEEEEEE
jgi:troponin T